MTASTKFGTRILAAVVIIMALAALAGCGSKEKTESATQKSEAPAADKTMAGTESQGVAGEQKTQPAADWSEWRERSQPLLRSTWSFKSTTAIG